MIKEKTNPIIHANGPPLGFEIWEETEMDDIAINIYDPSKLPQKYILDVPDEPLIKEDLKNGRTIPGVDSIATKVKILRCK